MRASLVITITVIIMVVIAISMILAVPHARKAVVKVGLITIPADTSRILVSSVFKNGSQIPIKYTCDGADVSIPISLGDIPNSTKSIMVVMEDLNAPGGVFIHWVLYDVPPNVTQIPEGLPAGFYIPGIGYQGVNDFGRIGYGGPCPPPGPPHEYVVVVLALKTVIKPLPNVSDRYLLSLLNESDVVGYGILIGYYGG
ncbi:MAG: YbhB/YbcL family Raf kinase inhibitor-like protein [Vulcanisaeta sp.]|nr:YbhB/YbcL family Raf kinase inhibitor-like protein [Vulcanisaeta sp.]